MQNGFGLLATILVLILVVVGGFLLFGNNADEGEPAKGEGRVYFSITDAAADMGAVSEITLTVDDIELYSETEGWTRVSTKNDEFALLSLRDSGTLKLAGQGNVNAGTYSKVRVSLDSAVVEETSGEVKNAAMATKEFAFDATVTVEEQAESHVTLDVLADKSLFVTEEGAYVFAPVLLIESRSNTTVEIDSSDSVSVSGGAVTASGTFGTDLDGTVEANFELPADIKIDVGVFGNVQSSSDDDETERSSDTSVEGSVDGSVETGNGGVDASVDGSVNTNL